MSAELSHAAFTRFIAALHAPRDPAALSAAVTPEVAIHRHAPGAHGAITAIAESFTGLDEVARWLARTPPVVRFSLTGPATPEADLWLIAYAIDAGEFHNGGLWRARLAPDGRIAVLSHHPLALPAER